jgi:hypothetical protein
MWHFRASRSSQRFAPHHDERGRHGRQAALTALGALACAGALAACAATPSAKQGGGERGAHRAIAISARPLGRTESLARSYGPAAIGNEHAAYEAAQHLLDVLALPAGAREVGIDSVVRRLFGRGAVEAPQPAELIDVYRLWHLPGEPAAALAWITTHAPRTARLTGHGTGGEHKLTTSWFATLAFPTEPSRIAHAQIRVEARRAKGGGTALRLDGQTVWTIPRPAGERIPRGVRSLHITIGDPRRHLELSRTVTTRTAIARVIAALEGLQRPWEEGACAGASTGPGHEGATVQLVFATAAGKPLARAIVKNLS